MNVDFPFQLDARGRTATVDDEKHVRDLIELVLFTSTGERVERPDFGSDLQQLIFGPATPELAATIQSLVQGALQRWLGDRLRVDSVDVTV
jgi:phage baseplate assembly protein W